jgi:phage terminase small subunit
MRGRKPLPTAVKIRRGCRSDRINRNEPVIPPAKLDPLAWIDQAAREHWAELAPVFSAAGVLTAADRQSLALLCEAFSRFQSHPDNDKARELYRRLSVEFGLTPSSRSRISAVPSEVSQDDAWAQVLSLPSCIPSKKVAGS